jgi:NADH-quinone oxidoreductase subunit N
MLSFVPKVVGFSALLRLLPVLGASTLAEWSPAGALANTLAVVAIATMLIGNLMALRQTHLHRLLAYSSVAHAGYMLVGLAVGGSLGLSSLLFYLVVYGVMTIGVFAVFAALGGTPVQTFGDLSGLSRTHPVAALMLAVCLFGLTGLPPTVGFLGKLNLFAAGWSDDSGLGQVLAVALAFNAAIAAWYYLRLVAVLYLDAPPRSSAPESQIPAWVAAAICSAATLVVFVAPQWLWTAARAALSAG